MLCFSEKEVSDAYTVISFNRDVERMIDDVEPVAWGAIAMNSRKPLVMITSVGNESITAREVLCRLIARLRTSGPSRDRYGVARAQSNGWYHVWSFAVQ